MKGKLIIIEGLDGSGKSTQIEILRKKAQQAGKQVRQIKFPNYAEDSSALVRAYLAGELGSCMRSTPMRHRFCTVWIAMPPSAAT